MSTTMRAKMVISTVKQHKDDKGNVTQEDLSFMAVGPNKAYPADGSDEDNTFAKWTPMAHLNMSVLNPALHDKFEAGDAFHVDFTPVPAA